ncbi:PAAR domain-containing protein, partial [Xanthomonas oryzae]
MRRMWIVVGDPTSGGGQVITGSRETDVDGLPVARVGDRATCRKHKGIFAIVDGDPTIIIEGQPVALDGAHLACGCTISTQRQSRNYV